MTIVGHTERIDKAKSDEVLSLLATTAAGPAEAYAILILSIYRLNFECHDKPMTLTELADSARRSILSIKKAPVQ